MSDTCICGSAKLFDQCCGRFLEDKQSAKTPEQLMRSRYSAYALGGYGEYLLQTWLPSMARGLSVAELSHKNNQWVRLEVLDKLQQGDNGMVEFMAYHLDDEGNEVSMHEKSIFKRIKGQWHYVGAEIKGGRA